MLYTTKTVPYVFGYYDYKAVKPIGNNSEAKEFLDKSFGIQYCISTEVGLSVISHPPREVKGVPLR